MTTRHRAAGEASRKAALLRQEAAFTGQEPPKGAAGFGLRLAQTRIRLGLSRKELGQRCGHSHVMIGRWETNANSPVLENVEPLAVALGVCAVWLAYGIGA